MNNNPPFARITATLMIAAGLGAGWTGYQYHQNSIADQFHISEASELRVRILQAIYMSERAATNSTLVDELSALDSGIESSFQRLINGDPSKGIPPPAQSLVSQALQLQTIWASILTNLDPIIGSKLSTEAFTRARVDTLSALEPALVDTQTALARHKLVGGADTQQKTLMSAAESLREAATIVNSETANIESLRSAEAAISSYLGSISSIARNLPKDNELLEVMGRSYRGVQNVQRQMARMIDTAGSASTNVPHARAIWAERDRVNAASASMVDIAKTLPSLHVIQPLIVGILGAIALLMAVISSIVTQRSAANRAQVVETRGNTIMSSQKDRSKDLTQLLNDIHAFGNGKIEHLVVDDRESTKEIAKDLNDVFGKLRAIIEEADSTIAGLSAATEQTVLTSQNVDRNRQEQLKALEHINRMIGDLVLFIGKVQQMTSQTDSVSKDVTRIVTSGSSAVQEVHEGILQISDTNTGIQHRSKSLIESFSQLESIAAVVKQVAEKSELLSWNARLAVGAAGDTESARGMQNQADAIETLAAQCHKAVSEIDVITREMIAAARETQHAVDTSQRAIDGLLNRSVNAQTSLGDISQMTNSLSSSVSEVTTSTSSLNHQMTDMEQTMAKVMGYSAANAAASEDTARAVSNVNRSAQELHKIIQGFIKGK